MICPRCGKENVEQSTFCQACGASFEDLSKESGTPQPTGSLSTTEYAGFWRRVVAALIDGVVLNIAGFIIGLIFGFLYGVITRTTQGVEFFGNVLGVLLGWLYYVSLESSPTQATLGKMAIGIIVTDLDGKRISFGKATGRHFAKIISALILLIGFIMAGFTKKKQALHDMIASCLVVKKG